MKLTSRIGETKSVSQVKEQIVDVHLDYIEKDGYVWRYNEDTKKYYNTGICLMGKQGNSGPPGRKGDNGLSAYQIAKEHGFDGNVQDWLNSLKGKSAYEIAVENGFTGTVEEWLEQIINEDISYKENALEIESFNSNTTVSLDVGKYYITSDNLGTVEFELPDLTPTGKVQGIIIYFTTSSTPAVTFDSNVNIRYSDGFSIDANTTYEVNCLFNDQEWVITNVIIE